MSNKHKNLASMAASILAERSNKRLTPAQKAARANNLRQWHARIKREKEQAAQSNATSVQPVSNSTLP